MMTADLSEIFNTYEPTCPHALSLLPSRLATNQQYHWRSSQEAAIRHRNISDLSLLVSKPNILLVRDMVMNTGRAEIKPFISQQLMPTAAPHLKLINGTILHEYRAQPTKIMTGRIEASRHQHCPRWEIICEGSASKTTEAPS